MKRALITGITGQDGSYLAELLLEKGYEVHGLVRRVALEQPTLRLARITAIRNKIVLHAGSLESYPSLFHVLSRVKIDECYHLAAQSFVAESFEDGFSTMNTNSSGTHYLLEALHQLQPRLPVLFCRIQRNVRQGAGNAAAGSYSVPSAEPLRHQQSCRLLSDA